MEDNILLQFAPLTFYTNCNYNFHSHLWTLHFFDSRMLLVCQHGLFCALLEQTGQQGITQRGFSLRAACPGIAVIFKRAADINFVPSDNIRKQVTHHGCRCTEQISSNWGHYRTHCLFVSSFQKYWLKHWLLPRLALKQALVVLLSWDKVISWEARS